MITISSKGSLAVACFLFPSEFSCLRVDLPLTLILRYACHGEDFFLFVFMGFFCILVYNLVSKNKA